LGSFAQRVATGQVNDRGKMGRRLGSIEARYPWGAESHRAQLAETPAGPRVNWQMRVERRAWQARRERGPPAADQLTVGTGGGVGDVVNSVD
jgi:hypothetical protein